MVWDEKSRNKPRKFPGLMGEVLGIEKQQQEQGNSFSHLPREGKEDFFYHFSIRDTGSYNSVRSQGYHYCQHTQRNRRMYFLDRQCRLCLIKTRAEPAGCVPDPCNSYRRRGPVAKGL